jgi:hypothetical protein
MEVVEEFLSFGSCLASSDETRNPFLLFGNVPFSLTDVSLSFFQTTELDRAVHKLPTVEDL